MPVLAPLRATLKIKRKQVKVNVCRCDVLVVGEIPQHVEKCQLHMRLAGTSNLKNLSSQAAVGKAGKMAKLREIP